MSSRQFYGPMAKERKRAKSFNELVLDNPSQVAKSLSEQAKKIKKANKHLFDRLSKL